MKPRILSSDEIRRALATAPDLVRDLALTAQRFGEALEQYAKGDTPPYDEEQGAGYTARQALGWCCGAPDVIFDGKVNRCRNCLATKGAA